MLAMIVDASGKPLRRAEIPRPRPCAGQLLIRVHACAVCRTDLHILDGELPPPKLPLIPGHEAVGTVVELGDGVSRRKIGDVSAFPGWVGLTEFVPTATAAKKISATMQSLPALPSMAVTPST